jgi:hypothetical protein
MEGNMQPNNVPVNNTPAGGAPMNPISQMPPHESKSSIGSIIGTIIVIAIIILGGLYFWGKRIDEARMKEGLVSNEQVENTPVVDENMEANAIMSVTKSDDLNSIEADLKATNLDNLGAELDTTAELE